MQFLVPEGQTHFPLLDLKMFDLLNQWFVVALISVISWIFIYTKKNHSYWEKQGVKGPKPLFLIGNTAFSKSITDDLVDNYTKYGKIYGTYQGTSPHLHVGEPELIRQICYKDFHIFPQGFEQNILGSIERNFLTALYGEKWKRMRKAQKKLVKLTSSKEPDFDPKYFWGRYNLDVITKCFFATSFDVYNSSDDEVLRHFVKAFEPNWIKIVFLVTAPKWFLRMIKMSGGSAESLNYLKQLALPIIEQRKKGNNKGNDFLQLLIDAEVVGKEGEELKGEAKKLSSDEIISSTIIFLLAGYETTSTLLTWACYRLSTNPDIQEKLHQEVSQANIEDYEVLQDLPYLEAVISETLRIDPPILLFQRVSHSDYVLPGTEIKIKKGTVVTFPVYAMHHDPENYPDPEVFDPNRFLEGSPKPFTFLPFGAGPRTCIGMRFALINAKLSLASLVRNYQLFPNDKTPSEIEHVTGTFIKTAKTLTLGIKPRY
uniref:Cytochrome P450 n=1 Tax=Tetranychus urticae TaxID=32264 RepID=T1K707_TETUR